eukprot:814117_1
MATPIPERKPTSSNSIAYSKVSGIDVDDDLDISDYDYDNDEDEHDSLFENKLANNNSKSGHVLDEEDTIRCDCFNWMRSYFKALAFTVLFLAIYLILLLLNATESRSDIYRVIEFLFLWLLVTSVSRILIHLGFHGWLVWKSRSLPWINKYESLQNIFFYIEHSKSYLQSSVVSIVSLMWFTSLLQLERYRDVAYFTVTDEDYYTFSSFMIRTMTCVILLFTALWGKKIFVRWWIIENYLGKHIETIDEMKAYESWIKILLNKNRIFSVQVRAFLNVHGFGLSPIKTKKRTVFRVAVLLEQTQIKLTSITSFVSKSPNGCSDQKFAAYETIKGNLHTKNISSNSDKYNTHSAERCLLWLYSPKKQETSFMDDTELHKLCKMFAQYIISHIENCRPDSDNCSLSTGVSRLGLANIQTMFKSMMPNKPEQEHKHNHDEHSINETSESLNDSNSMLCLTDGVTQTQFMRRFMMRNKQKKGLKAWKKMHFNSNNEILTRNEMRSWLYSYLRRLIYLRQTLDSYHSILSNMQNVSAVFVVFLLCFIFLLIFDFDFVSSISVFFSFTAICAVFVQNSFVQYFDGFCFVFVVAPYSIGDVVLIDGARFVVKQINVMSTVLLDPSNAVTIENNSFLLKKQIKNLTLTDYSRHILRFYVSQLTTTQQLNALKRRMESFVSTKMSNDISDVWFILDGVDEECRMQLRLIVSSFYSFSNKYAMLQQYHQIQMKVHQIIIDLGIEYRRFSNQDIQTRTSVDNPLTQ